MYRIEVVKNKKLPWKKQRYHWRIKVGREIIATSEQYYNYDDCYAVARNLERHLLESILTVL